MSRKNITLWNERFELLKECVEEFGKLPTAKIEYKGIKIGGWLQNQRTAYKNGKLPEECSQALFNAYPFWCSSVEEINEGNKKLLINSNWKSKVPEGKMPIDEVFSGDKLYEYLNMGIYDLETLVELYHTNEGNHLRLTTFQYFECLSKIIPIVNPRYASLLLAIFGEPKHSFSEMKEFFYSFCISSAEDMEDKMERMLESLYEREKGVLKFRFAINEEQRYMYLDEVGKIYGVQKERIRQIENKALRKLRHPDRLNILFKFGTSLDEVHMDRKLKAELFHRGINSLEVMEKAIEDETLPYELREAIKVIIKRYQTQTELKQDEDKLQYILETPIDELRLGVRAYNCLRRAGYYTVKDLVIVFRGDMEKALKIRNLGKRSLEEVIIKLKELGVFELDIEEETSNEKDEEADFEISEETSELEVNKEPETEVKKEPEDQTSETTDSQKNLHKYFISFSFMSKDGTTPLFGSTIITLPFKIDDMYNLRIVSDYIAEVQKMQQVVILNFQLID